MEIFFFIHKFIDISFELFSLMILQKKKKYGDQEARKPNVYCTRPTRNLISLKCPSFCDEGFGTR